MELSLYGLSYDRCKSNCKWGLDYVGQEGSRKVGRYGGNFFCIGSVARGGGWFYMGVLRDLWRK